MDFVRHGSEKVGSDPQQTSVMDKVHRGFKSAADKVRRFLPQIRESPCRTARRSAVYPIRSAADPRESAAESAADFESPQKIILVDPPTCTVNTDGCSTIQKKTIRSYFINILI